MKTNKPERLSKFYVPIIEQCTGGDDHNKLMFNSGFMYGLAEKVYIGACDGAMTRSYYEDCFQEEEKNIFRDIASKFDLYIVEINRSEFVELWYLKWVDDAQILLDNPNDNVIRGNLCGYPDKYINPNFELEK